jgi:beta-glucosidase
VDTSLTPEERAHLLIDASTLDQKLRWLVEHSAWDPASELCWPGARNTDGPQGVRGDHNVTAFPAPVCRAATWDTELAYQRGQMHAVEAFLKLANIVLAPGLNIARVPYNGRNSEYFGEDPLLTGKLGVAEIKGLQSNPEMPVIATMKHYVANNQEENRHRINVNVDERTLRQIYLPAWEMGVKDAQPGSVMCAYNKVNGTYSCENKALLNDILKDEWGFEGFVMSDFRAGFTTVGGVLGGLDQELGRARIFCPDRLKEALADGDITEADIDEMVYRIVLSHFQKGTWDTPFGDEKEENVSTPEHRALARQLATEGIVLLKNSDGILPIADQGIEIAVIGPTAGEDAEDVCGLGGSAGVECDPVTPLEGITERAAQDGSTVVYDDGTNRASAAAVAQAADVAIVFGYYTAEEGRDIEDLALDGDGDALTSAVAAANPNTIVVLQTGGPVLMPWLEEVQGVLEAWYGGVEMAGAISDVLFGDYNPSGKLPQTFPVSEDDLPTAGNPLQYPGVDDEQWYSEGLEVGYRWFDAQDIEPLFPFGFGLSYTTFEYSQLVVTPKRVQSDEEIRVLFRVTNAGEVAGTEIAQVYLSLPDVPGEPPKRLVGWAKVPLEPGQHQIVTVRIDPTSSAHPLSHWDTDAGSWTIAPGDYTFMVGSSSRDLPLVDTIEIWQEALDQDDDLTVDHRASVEWLCAGQSPTHN